MVQDEALQTKQKNLNLKFKTTLNLQRSKEQIHKHKVTRIPFYEIAKIATIKILAI